MKSSLLSFTDMLRDTSSAFDFTSTSPEATGITSVWSPQTHFGSANTTGAPNPLAGTDSPAYIRLQHLYQQQEARTQQATHDYERLR
jgi:hypothetical protein